MTNCTKLWPIRMMNPYRGAAKKYLSELESIGILAKNKIGKEYVWFNTELMDTISSEC